MTDVTRRTPDPLIAADRVTGTAVYNRAGEKLGTVDNIMIDKISGKAVYGIMSFGGFLGIGENQYPLPWSQLTYDKRLGGYVVDLDKRVLEGAPSYARTDRFEWTPEYGRSVDKYYRVPSYWD